MTVLGWLPVTAGTAITGWVAGWPCPSAASRHVLWGVCGPSLHRSVECGVGTRLGPGTGTGCVTVLARIGKTVASHGMLADKLIRER